MTRWNGGIDRGLGYLGLFLIGAISWLADHVGGAGTASTSERDRPQPKAVAGSMSASVRALPDARAGQHAA